MTNGEIISTFVSLAQSMTTQAQAMRAQVIIEIGSRVQPSASTTDSRLRDFMRMNPHMFYGSKVNEDPQYFIEKVYNIIYVMGLTLNEKSELASYQLKDVTQTWYTQWRDNRALGVGLITWEVFRRDLVD